MYLQSLELLGFKSFAQKTTLTFHRGVTAVVGPNGCGKSNVLDAIRWVLGEQSAKALRGGEMSDVIFSGTDSRQPLGMAEVSLSFAECEQELGVDWNEVRITRRVHRDGRSEYFLNKAPCRLRDIHQLFMDTGIGRSAYSIMEQGKIDQILSSRPEDRRAIFEEAAGITKFKAQKKEALRKLEHTEANLLRVTDIIKEVKRQIGSLQRQAGKARRYQGLISDLKTFETHLNHREFSGLSRELDQARAELARLEETQARQQTEVDEQESALGEQRHGLELMEEQLAEVRQAVQDLKNQIQSAEHRIGFNTERVTELQSLMERYERDIAAAEEKLKFQETQIQNTDLELEQISGTLEFEQARLHEKQTAAGELGERRSAAEREIQALFQGISRAESKLTSVRGQIGSIVAQREGQESRLQIIVAEIEQLGAAAGLSGTQRDELARQIEDQARNLETHGRTVAEADAQVKDSQAQLRAHEQEIHQQQRLLSERESKLEVLRNLNDQGEGFTAGTQAILRGLDNADFFKPAIQGSIASGIDVEPAFIPAIEAALGQNLQAILFKDAMVAESAIKTLAGQKLGRASLAIRDFLPASAAPLPALPEGAIAWAIEKVRAGGEIGTLISHLLHGVALVDDIDALMRLKAAHPALSFVTLAGETVSVEGLLQGGQNGDTSGSVLRRKAQIATIDSEVAQAREALSALQARREESAVAVEAAQLRLQEAREETQRLTIAVSTLRGQFSVLEREHRDAVARSETLTRERAGIENRQQESAARLGMLEREVEAAEAELASCKERQVGGQAGLEALREEETGLASEVNELRVKVATERQRHQSLANQRQPMASRLQELRDLIQQRQYEIDGYRTKSRQLAEDSERIREGIASTRIQSVEAGEEVTRLIAGRAELSHQIEALDSQLRILRRQLNENHDQRSHQEVRQTQLQLRIEHLAEHIRRRYQLELPDFQPDLGAVAAALAEQRKRQNRAAAQVTTDPEEGTATPPAEVPAAEEAPAGIDWAFLEICVQELDQKIESMGPINIDAIQEYDELEQRHQFLESQFTDLTNSKAELLDVISKINTTTRDLFADTFEKVRVNFQEMFTELFGGGKANLLLVDESDPLESGIDIIAKPPGKQLQSISLLSGGEKTMTAVSLLFAIYMVKPSPFCVLDEMDAPLDESNITRFIKILDRFVSQSQFVVITHNKRTIAKADVLYGVTMEEHGISKLVGVKFARREDSAEGRDIIGTANPSPVPSIAESFGKSGELQSEAKAG